MKPEKCATLKSTNHIEKTLPLKPTTFKFKVFSIYDRKNAGSNRNYLLILLKTPSSKYPINQ